jgi:uncharacterized protein involved in exopolysaccharide biosynthesis
MSPTSEHTVVGDGRKRAAERRRASARPTPEHTDDHPLGPLRPVVARWWLVAIVTAIFVAGGVLAGAGRTPTYTASTTLNVGRVDVRVQALPGYVAGATSLAASYSRITTSDEVVVPLAQRLHMTPAQIRARLGATQVPNAPMFSIFGTGGSDRDAIAFTQAATSQVERYVKQADNGTDSLDGLLRSWRSQAAKSASLRRRIGKLPSGSAKAAGLQTDYDEAQLKEQALRGQYQDRSSELASTAGIEVITPPTTASSDRHRTMQRFGVLGLIAGVLVGSALALVFPRLMRRTRSN